MNRYSINGGTTSTSHFPNNGYTKQRGYLVVRIPVTIATWLETMVRRRNPKAIDWHGRIPPLKDSISARYSNLVLESIISKTYLQKIVRDPAAIVPSDPHIYGVSYCLRLRLRDQRTVEKLLNSAREFERGIGSEVYQRALDSLTDEELADYRRFSETFKKGEYVPTTSAIIKAMASKQNQKEQQ